MNIAFFEIKDWEIKQLEYVFRGHKLKFYKEIMNKSHIKDLKDCDIISLFIYSKINKAVLSSLPNLRYITTRSMGLDHIDLDACKKSNIKVSNTPHYGDNSVAEHTFGLILSLSKNIHKAYVRTLNENYSIEGLKGFDLKAKTLGVLGVGRIGYHVIKMAKGFEMNVIACDSYPNKKFEKDLGFKYVSFEELLKNSDIISIHVPYTKKNHHLFDEKTLTLMKTGSVLINTSRGSIVDTQAVLKALEKEKLSGLGIDVIEGEELIKEENELLHDLKKLDLKKMRQIMIDRKLLQNEKVVFTPHIAFYSQEAVQRIIDVTIDNINAFISGKPINIVN